jgi:hypothetical protein
MKRHNKVSLHRGLLAALFSCSAMISASSVTAGVLTLDASVLAQAKNLVSNGQAQNLELSQIKSLEQQQLDAMGSAGPLGSLLGTSGLGSLGSQSDFYENMQKFTFDPCAVNLCQNGSNPVGTTDIEEARDWAMENFFAGDILTPSKERDLREVRRRGTINASVDGLALATITHNDLAGAGGQADALDQVVAASSDFRGDIRANSAIALATYKIEIQKLAMLTSLLEIQAMANINDVEIYHENGGTSFPDAVNDDDYAVNSPTTRIAVTAPDQGSAGASGLGGALINAVSGNGSVSDILSGAGISDAADLPTNISDLTSSIASGALPGVSPENMNMSTIVADTASVARAALPDSAPAALSNSMAMVQTGLSNGGANGNTTAMMGLAQSFATTGGNQTLSAVLNTGSLAIDSGTDGAATSFADGVLRDLKANGITGQYVDYIESSIEAVQSGGQSSTNLVLDSAAIYSALGSDANSRVSEILQIDPAGASDTFFKDTLADAMDQMSAFTGNTAITDVAQSLRSVTESDVAALREATSINATAPQGQALTSGSQTVFE